MASSPVPSSLFTSLLGNSLGDLLNDTLGLEPSDEELKARYEEAFACFDADKSGTLELDEVIDAFATLPITAMKNVKEAEAEGSSVPVPVPTQHRHTCLPRVSAVSSLPLPLRTPRPSALPQ